MNRLAVGDYGSPVVAGTAGGLHTFARIIQEGACRAGATIYRDEVDMAGDIFLIQSTAGGLAGADVVLVGHRLGAGSCSLCCEGAEGGGT